MSIYVPIYLPTHTFGKQTVYADGTIKDWIYLVSSEVASIGTVQNSEIYGKTDSLFYRCESKSTCHYEININKFGISCDNDLPIVRLKVGKDWFKYKSVCFETGDNKITYYIANDDDLKNAIVDNNTAIAFMDIDREGEITQTFSLSGSSFAMNAFEEGVKERFGYSSDSILDPKNENDNFVDLPDNSKSTVVEVTANSGVDTNQNSNVGANILNTSKPYYLQAGAFTNIQDAYDRRNVLNHLGINAFLVEAEIDGQKWHRVRFGPFNDSQSLNNAKKKLGEIGMSYFVVKPER